MFTEVKKNRGICTSSNVDIWVYQLGDPQYVATRVESGSDDPDNLGNLGHFLGGSSGSHPQINYLDLTRMSNVH